MGVVLLWLWAMTIVAAFAVGMWRADSSARAYWKTYRFCPTCERRGRNKAVR